MLDSLDVVVGEGSKELNPLDVVGNGFLTGVSEFRRLFENDDTSRFDEVWVGDGDVALGGDRLNTESELVDVWFDGYPPEVVFVNELVDVWFDGYPPEVVFAKVLVDV
jgi:hypothetical protein